jgi:hypothetical protein
LGQLPAVAPFYLAGGSAVALHLGHRQSVDLDFFIAQATYEIETLLKDLQNVGHLTVQQQSHGTLNAILESTQVSFFVYPYPLLENFHTLWDIQVAGLLDLALMKLISISQRGAKRDFIDLYQICHIAYTVDHLLPRLTEKYPKITYPSYHILRSLAYFEDAEPDPMPTMLIPVEWAEVKHFFEEETRRLMRELL